MYTINTFNNLIDDVFNEPIFRRSRKSYTNAFGNFDATVLENGKQQVIVNTTGHNPKDIKVDVTDTEIKITSKKGENTSRFVSDIDLTLTVGKDYDGTKTEAKFENGLLTLLIDKKEDKKTKSLKISY
jgi:HSP20 family molecular chaperone IbpA